MVAAAEHRIRWRTRKADASREPATQRPLHRLGHRVLWARRAWRALRHGRVPGAYGDRARGWQTVERLRSDLRRRSIAELARGVEWTPGDRAVSGRWCRDRARFDRPVSTGRDQRTIAMRRNAPAGDPGGALRRGIDRSRVDLFQLAL